MVLVGVMGLIDRGSVFQSGLNVLLVLVFLLLIVRRMPSGTRQYNRGYIFSHINIFMTYLAALVANDAVTLDPNGLVTLPRIAWTLLLFQLLLMLYLLQVSFGKAR